MGFLLACEMVNRDCKAVILVDLSQVALDEAVSRLNSLLLTKKKSGGAVIIKGYVCNVSDADAVKRLAENVQRDVGDVDILVNNAGIVSGKPFLQLTEDQIRRTFAVNTLAHFWTSRAFLPGMVKRDHGMLVTVSSAAGIVGTNGLADYCGSKFAVYGFDESIRLDLRKQGSRVHTLCVCPFYINTGLFDGVTTKVPLLLPILDAATVAQQIADAMEQRLHYLEVPGFALRFAWMTKVLPTPWRDSILDALGITSSMDDFRGRTNPNGTIKARL